MLETILNDVLGVLRGTFIYADWISILIALSSVLVAAVTMRRSGQIGSMTLLALTLYAVGGYLRGVFAGPAPEGGAVTGGRLAGQLESSWSIFMGLTASTLLAYFLAFMFLILVFFSAKALLSR